MNGTGTNAFRHHFSHAWLDNGGAEGDLMELNGCTSPQMLRRYATWTRPGGPRSARVPVILPGERTGSGLSLI